MEKLQIVKMGDWWVVAFENSFDDPGQRSILSASKSREQALEDALIHATDIQNKHEKYLYSIAECLNTDINIGELCQPVVIPGVFLETDCGIEEKISCIFWDNESKKWLWSFR
jgi:hypothetical protein